MTKINCFLVETEKSYKLQENNVYTIAFWDKNFNINKIELAKLLKKIGLEVLNINSTKSYQKTKFKTQKRNKVLAYKPKKWFISLSPTSKIDAEIIEKINQETAIKFNSSLENKIEIIK
jgi:hypothetical protein